MLVTMGNSRTMAIVQPDGTVVQMLQAGIGPTWQQGHEHFIFSTPDFRVWIANGDGTDVRPVPEPQGRKWVPVMSPDGSRLAGVCGNRELCVSAADGANLRVIPLPVFYPYVYNLVWSRDGHRIAFDYSDFDPTSNIAMINVDDPVPAPLSITGSRTGPWGVGKYNFPKWSPDGTNLAFIHTSVDAPYFSTVEVLDMATGQVAEWAQFGDAIVGDPSLGNRMTWGQIAWSPDGQRLAALRFGLAYDLVLLDSSGQITPVPGMVGIQDLSWI
jgi:hypothetical protein